MRSSKGRIGSVCLDSLAMKTNADFANFMLEELSMFDQRVGAQNKSALTNSTHECIWRIRHSGNNELDTQLFLFPAKPQ